MRKFIYAALLAGIFTACGENNTKFPHKNVPKINLTIDSNVLYIGEKAILTITSSEKLKDPVMFMCETDDKSMVKFDSEVMAIKMGESTTSFTVQAMAVGQCTISLVCMSSNVEVEKVNVSLTVNSHITLEIATENEYLTVGESSRVEIIANEAPRDPVTINLSTGYTGAAVSPTTVVIKAGEKSATAEVVGLEEGKAYIFAETDSPIIVAKTFQKGLEVIPKVDKTNILIGTVKPYHAQPEVLEKFNIVSFKSKSGDPFSVGGFFLHNNTWDGVNGEWSLSFDNYGLDIAGVVDENGVISFSAVEKGTDMDDLNWVSNPYYSEDKWYKMPYIASPYMKAPLTGDIYIALMGKDASLSGFQEDVEPYRIWIKFNPEDIMNQDLSKVEAALCLANKGKFKVGQTE